MRHVEETTTTTTTTGASRVVEVAPPPKKHERKGSLMSALSETLKSISLHDELLPLARSLARCDAGLIDLGRDLELAPDASSPSAGGGGGGKGTTLVQSLHRCLSRSRFKLGMYAFLVPWVGSMAVASASVAAAGVLLMPALVLLEVGFYVHMRGKRRDLLRVDKSRPIDREECFAHLRSIGQSLVDLSATSPDLCSTFISDWFNGADPREVSRGDALQWMSQSFIFRDFEDLDSPADAAVVEEITDEMEELLRHDRLCGPSFGFLPGGRKQECLKSGFNICGPYEMAHYPCCVYAGIQVFKRLVGALIKNLGFEKHHIGPGEAGERGGLTYWVRDASGLGANGKRETSPIIFFHGIGTGVSSYGVLLQALASAYPNSSIMVVDLPLVAMEVPCSGSPSPASSEDTLCKPLIRALLKHKFMHKRPIIMGHSFGCFACRWVLNHKTLSTAMGGCVLLDPLVFLLPYPDVSKRLQAPCDTFYEFLVRRLIMREPSVAYALNRKSKWPKCCLWEEDLLRLKERNDGFKMGVALSRHDCFFDVPMVEAYLDKMRGPTGGWMAHKTFECTHGELVFRPDLLGETMRMVNTCMH